jgi:GTP-dependent phosphoenolpyruvate carboxykinase
MRKIIEVSIKEPYILACTFENGEFRLLNLEDVIDKKGVISKKVFEPQIFKNVKIGTNGEIYWQGVATIKNLDGSIEPCEFDICPDYVYLKSRSL